MRGPEKGKCITLEEAVIGRLSEQIRKDLGDIDVSIEVIYPEGIVVRASGEDLEIRVRISKKKVLALLGSVISGISLAIGFVIANFDWIVDLLYAIRSAL